MESFSMPPNYSAIFKQVLLAQLAALGALTSAAARCAVLAEKEYQQAITTLAGKIPPNGEAAGPAHPSGGLGTAGASSLRSANLARALAGLPRASTMVFLSRYDELRGRRGAVRD
jgi:hypothetical protein